jgi:Catalase-related immune-responsive
LTIAEWHVDQASGDVTRHETGNEDNFSQCGDFFRNVLTTAEKERLTDNIAGNLIGAYFYTHFTLIEALSLLRCVKVAHMYDSYNGQSRPSYLTHNKRRDFAPV